MHLAGRGSKDKTAGETSEVSTQSGSTQTNPTFSREDLGAAVSECKYHLHKQKKALEYLQSSAPIAGSSNASELTSGSEDNDNSDNYNTESSNFRIANAHQDMFISNAQQAVENTGEFSTEDDGIRFRVSDGGNSLLPEDVLRMLK